MEKLDKNRLYHGYYLIEDPDLIKLCERNTLNACKKCALQDYCEEIADTMNRIEYVLCIDGIKDKKYKNEHPNSYFKKIEFI